ncbi:hypothetical protein [Bauldia sp.]|uniref:hypothetical protein n=1 Tax=Bauldia sp. TaxID=2575872 RepID=UPI003BAA6093
MPRQKQDIYAPFGPTIAFDQPNQKWNILNGVNVMSGSGPAVGSDGFDGITLVNKGNLLGPTSGIGAIGVGIADSDNATIDNRDTGYISGFVGLLVRTAASTNLLNEGQVLGGTDALRAEDAAALTVENRGLMTGADSAVDIVNADGLSGPLIENYGTMKAEDITIVLRLPNATVTIKNKPGGLIENTDGAADFAILLDAGRLKLNNKGTIIGKVDTDYVGDQRNHVITNNGEILALGEGAGIRTGEGNDTVTNRGTISPGETSSAVFTGEGNDTVVNEGTINGGINLSDDNDVYKNKGGKMSGRIDPGDGNDKLVLGNSKDRIEFDDELDAVTNVDRIKNFDSDKDKMFLWQEAFEGLTLGTLQKSEFTRGTEAKGDNAQIIYDKSNGLLWFDDGAGGDSPILFAELDDDTKLTHEDFTVYA